MQGLELNRAKELESKPQTIRVSAPELRFTDRNRRPPKDRFNCLLGFGYALLQVNPGIW